MANASALKTLEDVVRELGDIPLNRIISKPAPGTAIESDVVALESHDCLCELVDGVLVEKAMGYLESILAMALGRHLSEFVTSNNLGFVSGSDGMVRLFPGLIRIPDIAYASWARFPDGQLPQDAIADLAPDLAVEVLSRSNTAAEMERKRQEYFDAGVRLVWAVDPRDRTVTVFSSTTESQTIDASATLSGGDVLPGFSLPLAELFGELDRRASE